VVLYEEVDPEQTTDYTTVIWEDELGFTQYTCLAIMEPPAPPKDPWAVLGLPRVVYDAQVLREAMRILAGHYADLLAEGHPNPVMLHAVGAMNDRAADEYGEHLEQNGMLPETVDGRRAFFSDRENGIIHKAVYANVKDRYESARLVAPGDFY
jgi:hypothetical protein